MCTIQFVSDLHLEFYSVERYSFEELITPKSDVLILLGDIGHPDKPVLPLFLKDCSQNFKQVIFISGNHEYYTNDFTTTMDKVDKSLASLCSTYPNVMYLNNSSFTYIYDNQEIVFLGTTLWSKILNHERYLIKQVSNDLCSIFVNNQPITIDIINAMYAKNVSWLESELEKYKSTNKKIIVLTHHLPSFKAIAPKFQNSEYNSMFASNLDTLIKKYNIFAWLFGHTHTRIDIKISETILRCNPRGYEILTNKFENSKYNKKEVLMIE